MELITYKFISYIENVLKVKTHAFLKYKIFFIFAKLQLYINIYFFKGGPASFYFIVPVFMGLEPVLITI